MKSHSQLYKYYLLGVRFTFALNLALTLVHIGLWLIAWRQGLFWRADFTMLYTGGAMAREGYGSQLYDLELQARYQHYILNGKSFVDGVLPFNYPPYVALLMMPFTLLPLATAYSVWTILQGGLLVRLLGRLRQFTAAWDSREQWMFLAAVFAFAPLLFTFLLGSFSLLLLVTWVECYVHLQSDEETHAGLWLALGSLKPQSVLSLGLVILGACHRRALATVTVSAIILLTSTTLLLGLPIWRDFVDMLLKVGNLYDNMGIVLQDMHNFKALLAGILGPEQLPLINILSVSAFTGVVLWTLWIWRGPWRPSSPLFNLRLAVTCALGLFFSLHLYPQDSLLWIFPAFLGYLYLRECCLPRRGYTLFLLSWPCLFLMDEFVSLRVGGIRPALFLLGALLVWLCMLLWQADRRG